jgi:hypothetical protein
LFKQGFIGFINPCKYVFYSWPCNCGNVLHPSSLSNHHWSLL